MLNKIKSYMGNIWSKLNSRGSFWIIESKLLNTQYNKVEEFIVYNPEDYPTECPRGTLINNTSIHVIVSFKMKRPVLHGLFGKEVSTKIHRDLDNYYSLELEDL